MKTDEIREMYLDFFVQQGHTRKPSDNLVPHDDPSVLFTPAGMNQFKDHFLGKVRLDFTRATTCQKCLRTGDIDNVGRTPRHHTFFEMLGNFSFGDYFKREAIRWGWEFCTSRKWLGIEPARLKVSVYEDDDEAAEIWHSDVGLESGRIERMGEADNFWPASAPSQGPDGVCGPCSEIFYINDDGSDLEIWNLVFTQFNRSGDPPDNLIPLPSKNIDTGMGLERTAAVLQGVPTNFHIDILMPIVEAASQVCGVPYDMDSDEGRRLRRITDHIRACTFAVHEHVEPGKNKENYVVRRLLRRAVLDGHRLGVHQPFLFELVPTVVEMMRTPYPDLAETMTRVQNVIRVEEEMFFRTIDTAVVRIEKTFQSIQASEEKQVDGAEAGTMYTTYGVPPELFEQLARERGIGFDWDGYRSWMETHAKDSGAGQKELFQTGAVEQLKESEKETEFLGYEQTESEVSIRGLALDNVLQDSLQPSEESCSQIVVLDKSPFYGESGGQIGDQGVIVGDGFEFVVEDTQKASDLILHLGRVTRGQINMGDTAVARVDPRLRDGLRRAHSATHLLHHALQSHLGEHAQQRGSKVDDDLLRFDFKNDDPVSGDVLAAIEQEVTTRVSESAPIDFEFLPIEEARKKGAMMLFGEKYPDVVRMVSIGDFSKELCGGTHLDNTSEIEKFEIVAEEGISAGTRRIVALTGEKANENERRTRQTLESLAHKLGVAALDVAHECERIILDVRSLKKQISSGRKQKGDPSATTAVRQQADDPSYQRLRDTLRAAALILNVPAFETESRVDSLLAERDSLQKQLDQLSQSDQLSADSLIASAEMIGEVKVVATEIPGANPNLMRQLIDQCRKQSSPIAVMLGSGQGDSKVVLVAGVSRELVERGISAGEWVKQVAPVVGGGGGGKPDMAQAGGKDPSQLPAAMNRAREVMTSELS